MPFDPLTLVSKATPEVKPAIDLEAAAPHPPEAKAAATPAELPALVVKDDEDTKELHQQTQPEVPTGSSASDSPEDGQKEDVPVADAEPMRI